MKAHTMFVLAGCLAMAISTPVLGQGRQRQAGAAVASRPPLTRDQREDLRDRREDRRDRREDVRDRREDVRDAQRVGGIGDRREDVRDRREDGLDRREDLRDRREDRLDRNPQVREMLPDGTRPRNAFAGFKNEGQFFAALHASKNLNIPFNQLKARVTGDDAVSLGRAIHDLRPDLSESEVRDTVKRSEEAAKNTEKRAAD